MFKRKTSILAVVLVAASLVFGGACSSEKPSETSEPKTSLPEWGTVPLKVISIRPEPGSKVVLSPEGTFDVTVEFNQRIPKELSPLGFGGSLITGDIRVQNIEILGSTITWHCDSYPGKEFWLRVSLRDKDGKELQHGWPNYVMTKPVVNVDPSLAFSLHLSAWRHLISEAKEDDIARLALYATRTIAVKHPEIYLRADRLFYETAKTTKGLKELYEHNPPTWTYRPEELEKEERRFAGLEARVGTAGTPLDLCTLDLSAYHVVTRGELYPLGVPSYFLLDQRVGALPVVLKRDNGKVTSLEMAFLRYFVTGPSDKNYIVLSEDETAYLWLSGTGLLDSDGKRTEAVSARPILIFNERYVWFPSMGRDDTSRDHVLAELVRELSGQISSTTSGTADSPSPLPADVTSEEKDLLAQIAPLSALSEKDLPYAVWAASKARYRSAQFSPYREALKAIPYFPTDLGALESLEWQKFHIIGHTFQIHSNRVSPLTAWIAAQEFSDPLEKVRAISGLYYEIARCGPWTTARTVWAPELFWYDIEDSVLSRAGTCAIQSGIVHAILDTAGVENYLIWGWNPGGGHEYIYLPQFSKEINNGYLVETEGFLEGWLEPSLWSLVSLSRNGKFVAFTTAPFPGTMSTADAIWVLETWSEKFSRVSQYGATDLRTYQEILATLRSRGVTRITLTEGK